MNEIKLRIRRSRDWAGLIDALEREADDIEDKQARAQRLFLLGQAFEELFLRKDKAMVAYQKAFKLYPPDVQPLVRARRIYREMGNLRMVDKLIEFQLKATEAPKERAALLVELAEILTDLGDPDLALTRLNEAMGLWKDAPGLDEMLETLTYDRKAWRQTASALIEEAGTAADPRDAAQRLVRAARLYAIEAPREGEREELLRKALELDPSHQQASFLLEGLLGAADRKDEIVMLQHERAAAATEEDRSRLYRDFASQWAIRFADDQLAADFYARALETFYTGAADYFPGHLAAFAFLQETWRLPDAQQRLLDLADEGLQSGLLEEDAVVLAAMALAIAQRDPAEAARAAGYEEWVKRGDEADGQAAVEVEADLPPTREPLPEITGTPVIGDDEATVVAPVAPEASALMPVPTAPADQDAQQRDRAFAARAEEDELAESGDDEDAVETIDGQQRPLSRSERRKARRQRKTRKVQETVEAEADLAATPGDALPAQGPAAVGATSEALVEDGRAEAAPVETDAQAPVAELEAAQAAEESAAEESAADVAEPEQGPDRLPDAEAADVATADVATVDVAAQMIAPERPPEDEAAVEAADEGAAPEDVVEEVDQATQAIFQAAEEAERASSAKGIEAWRKAAQAAPRLRTPRRALARLYMQSEQWTRLVDVLKEEAELVDDPAQKKAIRLQLVALYRDRLKLDSMVIKELQDILKVDEYDVSVLDQLLGYYEKRSEWNNLIATLRRKAAAVGDGEQIAIWQQIARLYLERSGNQAEAIKAYEQILEIDPTDAAALSELKALYERRREWDKVIAVYQREIDLLADGDARAELAVTVAKLASEKLRRPNVATELWAKVLDLDPQHQEALEQLEVLYERAKEWENLADVCERQIDLLTDGQRQSQLWLKLGLLYAEKLNDETRAVRAWQALLKLEPENRRAQDALKKLYLTARDYPALEAFYAEQGKWDELIRVFERQVDFEEGEMQKHLYNKIAHLWLEKLAKPERAIRAYEKVLELDPSNLAAAEALIPLLRESRDVKSYARVLEVQLDHTIDPDTQRERTEALAQLWREKLRDAEQALHWYLRAFALDPSAEAVRAQVEALASETCRWSDLVEAFEVALTQVADPADQLPLLRTLARVYEQNISDTDRALAANRRILDLDPGANEALAALERLYTATEQWESLLEICEQKLAWATEDEDKKDICFRMAYLYEEELSRPERAIEAYRDILDTDSRDAKALRALERLYESEGQWPELAETLVRQLALAEDAEGQTALRYRLGQLRETRLDDVIGAIACYRDILTQDLRHAEARAALEQRLPEEATQEAISEILAPVYEQLGEWEALVGLSERDLQRTTDVSLRSRLLLQIGQLWVDKFGDGARAFDAYSRCFAEDCRQETAIAELERLAAIEDRWADVAALYDAAAQEAIDGPSQHRFLLRVAQIADEHLEDSERAIAFYRRALELEPDHSLSLDALERLYSKGERWADLQEVYRRKTEITVDVDERVKLFSRMAYVYEEMLSDPREAVACLNEILAIDPSNIEALRVLDRLYQVQGSWPELADNLARQFSLAEDKADRVDLLVRLASLRETALTEVDAAVDTYRQVLALDPRNRDAVEALERFVQQEQYQLSAAQILEPYYKTSGEWQKLVGVYEIMAAQAYDPAAKIERLRQVVELYELEGDDLSGAFSVCARAVREDPTHDETQVRLERLARSLSNWTDVITLYRSLVAETTDEALAIALERKVARIYEDELHDADAAAAAHQRILALDPHHVAAVDALEGLYLRSERYPQLVEILLKKAEMTLQAEQRRQLLLRSAQLYEDILEDADQAIAVYTQVAEADETDDEALDALERLYQRQGRWVDLKEIYRKKAELAADVDSKKTMLHRIGALDEHQLADAEGAIETYQQILDLDPEDRPTIQALDQLFEKTARWYDLLQVLERQVELGDPASRETTQLRFRIGQLWESQLTDVARAVETYRETLNVDPHHQPTLGALWQIAQGSSEPLLAAEVLEPLYERMGEWEKLVEVYEVMVSHATDSLRRRDRLHQMADVSERHLQDASRAFRAYGRALAEDSGDERTQNNLARLAAETGAWAQLAERYESELARLVDPIRQTEFGLTLARLYEERLSQPERAVAHYQRVLELSSDSREALTALDRLFSDQQRHDALAEILVKQSELAETEEEMIGLRFRLGRLYQEALDQATQAIDCYRSILAISPDHSSSIMALELLIDEAQHAASVAEVLEPLYRRAAQWEKLVRVMEVQLDQLQDPFDRIQIVQRIAEICELRMENPAAALSVWGRGLGIDPLSDLAAEELRRLAPLVDDGWAQLAGFYVAVLPQVSGDEQKPLLQTLAQVYEEKLNALAEAEETYRAVLAFDAEDTTALAALDRVYQRTGDVESLVEIVQRRIALSDATDELVTLQLRLGEAYDGPLADPERALVAFNAALEHDTRNRRALAALEQLHFRRGSWADLYDVYERMIDVASGDRDVAQCYMRMAKISQDALGRPEHARDLWHRVLDLRGEDATALAELAALYTQAEAWSDLVEVIERQVGLAEHAEDKLPLYRRLGQIWSEQLGRDRNALECWQEVLALSPDDLEAQYALVEIYERTQAWPELAEAITQVIALGAGGAVARDELFRLYRRLGELEGEILLRPDQAVCAWRNALAISPDDLSVLGALEQVLMQEARWAECVEVLAQKAQVLSDVRDRVDVLLQAAMIWQEKLEDDMAAAAIYDNVLALDPLHEIAFADMSRILRQQGQYERLIEVLLARADQLTDVHDRVALLQDVARVYETDLGLPDNAVVVLQAAFKQDYTNDATAREFERLASRTGKWNELLTEYNSVVQTVIDPQVKADLLVKIGRWYGAELGRMDYAATALQQALQLDPENVTTLAALSDLHRKTGQWEALADVIRRQVDLVDDPAQRTDLTLALADLCESRLNQPQQAITAYRRVLSENPDDTDALFALERLYRSAQAWGELVEVLRRKADRAELPEQIIEVRTQMGRLYEQQLDDSSAAIDCYRDILTIEPQSLSALGALERLYDKTGNAEAYIDVLEQQVDIVGSNEQRISRYQLMAVAWEERFGKRDRAAECLEKILLLDEAHLPSYAELARLYRQEQRFEELIDVMRREIQVSPDDDKRIALHLTVGEVYQQKLQDPDRAIEAYSEVLVLQPNHRAALAMLSRLYEAIESWDRAVDTLHALVPLLDEAEQRVDACYRLGRIYEEYLAEPNAAEEKYQAALGVTPTHGPSMVRLVEIYKQRHDWAKAARMMVEAEQHASSALERARLLYEAGMAQLQHLGDEGRGVELLAKTLELDPDHVQSGEPLAEIYFRDGRYAEAAPILEMLVRKSEREDNRTRQALAYKLAKTCDVLDRRDAALKHYQVAYDLDSTHLPTLLGMADLLHRMQEWDRAFKMYQTILVHHRDTQRQEAVVDIFYRLGQIKLQLGERKKALNMFEKALEIEAAHRPTLEAIVDLQTQQGEWAGVVQAKRALLAVASDAERLELHREMGDIYRDKLRDPQKAIPAYSDALAIDSQNSLVLHALIELYTETKQWKRAVEVMLKLTELESDSAVRAKYFYAIAVICRDELKALDEAADYFNRVLDEDVRQLKAFEAVDRLHTQKKDWKNLERSYRKMIKRMAATADQDELKAMLWHNLGEIYRTRLRDFASAAAAFDVASKMEPANLQRHEILAELYSMPGVDQLEKAVQQHHALISHSPLRLESYRALYQVYGRMGAVDKAWCVAAVLSYLKKAEAEEQAFFEQYRPKAFVRATSRMSDELWQRDVYHADEDPWISAIFAVVAPAVAARYARRAKDYKLKSKDLCELQTNKLLFADTFRYALAALNAPACQVYLQPDQPMGLTPLNTTDQVTFVVGADLLQGRPQKELAFAIGKQLSVIRPEHFLCVVLQTPGQLRTVFLAALRLCNPQFAVAAAELEEVDKLAKYLRGRLHQGQMEQLIGFVQHFVASKAEINLKRWHAGVQLTANRAGLILANDLDVAARMVTIEPATVGALPPKEKVKELVLYAISEAYFHVRAEMGLAVG